VIFDGTLIPPSTAAPSRSSASRAKPSTPGTPAGPHQHAGNLQALSALGGLPLWIAEVELGSVRDLTAAAAHGLLTLADSGYDGAGIGIHAPIGQPGGFALLKGRWRTLQHITVCPSRIGDIARVALVLTHFEHDYLPAIH
jgi:hypothetical protein